MADAYRVNEALPDVQIEHERYDFIRIHNLAFLPLKYPPSVKRVKYVLRQGGNVKNPFLKRS